MLALLAEVNNNAQGELGILFLILALLGFGAAIYLAVQNQFVAAAVAVLVAVVILVVT